MIFVDRGKVQPASPWPSRAEDALARATQYFAVPAARRSQRRFEFDVKVWIDLRPALLELFSGKCAYCESPIAASGSGEIDHFRPKAEAIGIAIKNQFRIGKPALRGKYARDGYWWLAYDWPNIFLACRACGRTKRNQFPVIGERAVPGTHGAALGREHAILLDPCSDKPDEFLVFDEQGRVSSRQGSVAAEGPFVGIDRGAMTIALMGLNRSDLVAARGAESKRVKEEWTRLIGSGGVQRLDQSANKQLWATERPYASMRRQFLGAWLKALQTTSVPDPWDMSTKRPIKVGPPIKLKKRATLPPSQIVSVRIQDFRSIEDLTLQWPSGTTDRAGWLVLLGENGAGKSSALQAIALALLGKRAGEACLRQFKLKPVDFLRKLPGDKTVKRALITVQFATGGTIELQITSRALSYSGDDASKLFLRAYGSTRLLPKRHMPRPVVKAGVGKIVANLFDSTRPIMNAGGWLAGLKGAHFDSAALSIKDLLSLPTDVTLRATSGQVRVPLNGLMIGLDELSAGYESVLAMASDLIAGVLGTVHDLRHATGIVLLDEIDAHLHPRWKMRIVESLRSTFSGLQFVVSTHEPLCLRGIEENEVVLFKRDGGDVSYTSDLPSPSTLRVDQLLTSELFGLHTLIDPAVDAKFQTYYGLLAKNDLTTLERDKLAQLRAELPPVAMVQLLGDNRREQLIYEAVDQYLAKTLVHRDRAKSDSARAEFSNAREDVKRRIAEIWQAPGIKA